MSPAASGKRNPIDQGLGTAVGVPGPFPGWPGGASGGPVRPGQAGGRRQPAQQLIVNLPFPGDQNMMGPPIGIGFHRHSHPGGFQLVFQTKGDNQAALRPFLPPAGGQGGGGKQTRAVKTDLALLYLDRCVRTKTVQPGKERLV